MRGLPHRLFSWSWSVGNVTLQRLFLAKLSKVFYCAIENVLLCKNSECLVLGAMHVMVRERGLAGFTQIGFSLCCYTLYTSASRGTQIGFSQVRVQPVHTRPPSPARRRLLACGLLPCPAPMRARRGCGGLHRLHRPRATAHSGGTSNDTMVLTVPRRTPAERKARPRQG